MFACSKTLHKQLSPVQRRSTVRYHVVIVTFIASGLKELLNCLVPVPTFPNGKLLSKICLYQCISVRLHLMLHTKSKNEPVLFCSGFLQCERNVTKWWCCEKCRLSEKSSNNRFKPDVLGVNRRSHCIIHVFFALQVLPKFTPSWLASTFWLCTVVCWVIDLSFFTHEW